MYRESSVLSSWVLAIYRTVQSYGIDPDVLLAQAGIDKTLLSQHEARVMSVNSNRLWQLAVRATQDELLGTRVIEYLTINSLYAVDAAAQSAATIRECLRRVCRFSKIVTTAVELELDCTGTAAEIAFTDSAKPGLCDQAIDAYMSILMVSTAPVVQLLETDQRFFQEIFVTRPQPKDLARYQAIFPCAIHYSQPRNRIVINENLLDIPVPGSNPEISRISEEMLVSYIARMENQDIEMKVRSAIMDLMNHKTLSKLKVAERLHMSVRNLTRKLRDVDVTFSQLVDSIRHEKAICLIKQHGMSLGEIAYDLGFVDVNSFIRAFRRWTGLTPGSYRSNLEYTSRPFLVASRDDASPISDVLASSD